MSYKAQSVAWNLFPGYYRVNYDERNWKLIIKQLLEDHTKINVINRAQLINDALNLATVGLLKYDLALTVTSYLNKETEYFPWYAALTGLEYVDNMLQETASYGNFKVSNFESYFQTRNCSQFFTF